MQNAFAAFEPDKCRNHLTAAGPVPIPRNPSVPGDPPTPSRGEGSLGVAIDGARTETKISDGVLRPQDRQADEPRGIDARRP